MHEHALLVVGPPARVHVIGYRARAAGASRGEARGGGMQLLRGTLHSSMFWTSDRFVGSDVSVCVCVLGLV